MKKKLIAAAAALAAVTVNAAAVSAYYGYDDTYGNYGYTDTTTANYSYNWYDDTSSIDPTQDHPSSITLEAGEIKDKKFSADLKIEANSPITAADITVTYDSDVLKLTSDSVNEEAGGTAVGTKLTDGVYEYVYTNYVGSEWEESYFTLDFEIIDSSAKSSVLYITVNSMLDDTNTEMTCVADGTVVQIEGAVPVDASADESMYSEIRVSRSDKPFTYDSLGLENVKSVTFEDGELASADENGISTLSEGITNMTVEYEDGTFGYFRLVISEEILIESDSSETSAAETTAVTQTTPAVSKTETKNTAGLKKAIVFAAVILALAAIVIEYFTIVKNPFAGIAEKHRERPKREGIDDDDFFPEPSNYSGDYNDYDGDSEESPETDSSDNNDNADNSDEPKDSNETADEDVSESEDEESAESEEATEDTEE